MFDSYAEIFTERAHAYHCAMERAPHVRDSEFHAVVAPLADCPDGIVCDVPAGACYLARYLPERMGYIGVEPVAAFADARPDPGLTVLNSDIADLPLGDGSVDHIVSLAGLHHQEDLGSVFREMRRLLKRGGRAIIADVAVDTAPARFLNGFVARHNPLGHDGRFLDGQTRRLLEDAGLAVGEDSLIAVPWAFDSFDHSGEFCGELFGIAGLRPHAIVEALDRELGFDMIDGRPHLDWCLRRIVCEAV